MILKKYIKLVQERGRGARVFSDIYNYFLMKKNIYIYFFPEIPLMYSNIAGIHIKKNSGWFVLCVSDEILLQSTVDLDEFLYFVDESADILYFRCAFEYFPSTCDFERYENFKRTKYSMILRSECTLPIPVFNSWVVIKPSQAFEVYIYVKYLNVIRQYKLPLYLYK